MSPEEYQELGKSFYAKKEYEQAKDAFTNGINANGCPPAMVVTLLDYRAATWEKLEDLQAGLRDARQMIKLQKQDVRGYLRTGKILQKMHNPEVALEIYQYGLKNVPVHQKDYDLLCGMRDRLIRQLSPPKSVDPFAVLPVELAEMVIGYLGFRNIVNCLRVSKHWNDFLSSLPELWLHLDLSLASKPVSPKFVRRCINRSRCKMQRISLHKFGDTSALKSVTTLCKELQGLELLQTGFGGESIREAIQLSKHLETLKVGLQTKVTLDAVTQILRYSSTTLKHAEFWSVESTGRAVDWQVDLPHLETLVLVPGPVQRLGSAALNLSELVKRIPNIRKLSLRGWKYHSRFTSPDYSSLQHLTHLDLPSYGHLIFPILPASLKFLSAPLKTRTMMFSSPDLLRTSLPVLEELRFETYAFSGQELGPLILMGPETHYYPDVSFSKLKKLYFAPNAFEGGHEDLLVLVSNHRLSSLEELSIPATQFKDDIAIALPGMLRHLKRLDISWTKVTGVGVKAIVQGLEGKLEWLGLDMCMDLSPDAVEWARKQGVEVAYKTYEKERSGRKVRHGH